MEISKGKTTFRKRFNHRLYSSSLFNARKSAPPRPSSTVNLIQNGLSLRCTSSTLARCNSITHGFVFASDERK
jgi:hypothetical protein